MKKNAVFLKVGLDVFELCRIFAHTIHAKVAQLVERDLAKVEVAGSNPVFRSPTKGTGNGAF